MESNRNTGRIKEPWTGTGWPVAMFLDRSQLTDKGTYCCARDGCSRDKYEKEWKRILREPWQLTCGHRLCKECYEMIRELPEDQRFCDACKSERLDCDGSRPHNFPEMDFDEPQVISDHRQITSVRQISSVRQITSDRMEVDEDRGNFQSLPVDHIDLGSRFDAVPSQRQIGKQPSHPVIMDNGTLDQSEMRQCIIDCTSAMRDNAANRELNKMLVKCPYDCGTSSKLTVRTIEKHMSSCKERLIPCDRCAEVITFSQSAVHSATLCPFRAVDCPNKCGKKGLKGNELTKHLAECEKRPPMCSICKNSYEYNEDIHSHLVKCVAKCPLNCSECSEERNIVEHLTSEHLIGEHMHLLLSLFDDAENAVKSPGESLGAVMAPTQLTPMLDTLLQLESKSDKTQRMLMEKVNHMTQESASGLLNNARLAEKNRIDLNDLEALFKVLAQDVHMLTSYDTAFRSLEDRTKKQEVETDDRLNKLETLSNVRIAEIEDQKTALLHFHMTAFNGHLIWKIDRVQQRRDEAHVKHSIYSHPFYTEVYGYKMCARIYFNGDGNGKNTHISLFFVVMKGEYDALLPWPFQQKVTMKLRNQTKKRPDVVEKFRPEPSSSSFQRPKNEMNIASGCPQFAEQSHVFSTENGFVAGDTIFIEISVDNAYEALHGLNISVQDMTRSFTSAGGK